MFDNPKIRLLFELGHGKLKQGLGKAKEMVNEADYKQWLRTHAGRGTKFK